MNFFRLSERALAALVFALVFTVFGGCGSSAPGTIGAALGQTTDRRLFVRSLPGGQGAERAGLALDDEILLIDGKDVRAMSEDDVRRAVRGDVGSTMVLTILRGTDKREVKVERTPLIAGGKSR
ncbi:MAG: PDZ domain-containing protein [Labilithrix sp.]|nr:PDZ domain-containing protein [Labilithrix sp.]MBX3220242.1 PDZ domain-containing protein [Labilithrix sp.]